MSRRFEESLFRVNLSRPCKDSSFEAVNPSRPASGRPDGAGLAAGTPRGCRDRGSQSGEVMVAHADMVVHGGTLGHGETHVKHGGMVGDAEGREVRIKPNLSILVYCLMIELRGCWGDW